MAAMPQASWFWNLDWCQICYQASFLQLRSCMDALLIKIKISQSIVKAFMLNSEHLVLLYLFDGTIQFVWYILVLYKCAESAFCLDHFVDIPELKTTAVFQEITMSRIHLLCDLNARSHFTNIKCAIDILEERLYNIVNHLVFICLQNHLIG